MSNHIKLGRSSYLMFMALTVFLVGLADFLFYRWTIGWTLGLYVLVVLCVVLFKSPAVWRAMVRGKSMALLTLILLSIALALFTAVRVSFLIGFMLVVMTVLVGLSCRVGWTWRFRNWIMRMVWALVMPFVRPVADALLIQKYLRRHGGSGGGGLRLAVLLGAWLLPLLLAGIFVVLFRAANPVIESWITTGWDEISFRLSNIFDFLRPSRIWFWISFGLVFWGLLRYRSLKEKRKKQRGKAYPHAMPFGPVPAGQTITNPQSILLPQSTSTSPAESETSSQERWLGVLESTITRFVIRSLILFNVVFLVQTLLDVFYLWGSLFFDEVTLPQGMSYATYAHRGAYPLVFTAILAAAFILITFRDHSHSIRSKWARRLVYAWLIQNVLLLMSAALRLEMYVNVYSLTRWRVAAVIWMGLIAMAFAWFMIRLLLNRDNRWMVRVNVLTLFFVLYSLCFINVDALIANYNVRHCREITGRPDAAAIDVLYLQNLGPDALPAVIWLEEHWPEGQVTQTRMPSYSRWTEPDEMVVTDLKKIQVIRGQLESDLDRSLQNWRGWTWQRQWLAGLGTQP